MGRRRKDDISDRLLNGGKEPDEAMLIKDTLEKRKAQRRGKSHSRRPYQKRKP